MAQATNVSIISPSRFHNLADPALADALGHADAVLKGAEAECKLLKDEFKNRGLVEVAGGQFTVTATEQITSRQYASGPRPVRLRLDQGSSIRAVLQSRQERRAQLPRFGLGHGLCLFRL